MASYVKKSLINRGLFGRFLETSIRFCYVTPLFPRSHLEKSYRIRLACECRPRALSTFTIVRNPLWEIPIINLTENLKIIQGTSWSDAERFGGGCVIWDSGYLFSKYLLSKAPKLSYFLKDKYVIELGCGTGICGLVCAELGARHVVLTDKRHVLEQTNKNIYGNPHLKCKVSLVPLDWSEVNVKVYEEIFLNTSMNQNHEFKFNMMICSDIVYMEPGKSENEFFRDISNALKDFLRYTHEDTLSSGIIFFVFEERYNYSLKDLWEKLFKEIITVGVQSDTGDQISIKIISVNEPPYFSETLCKCFIILSDCKEYLSRTDLNQDSKRKLFIMDELFQVIGTEFLIDMTEYDFK